MPNREYKGQKVVVSRIKLTGEDRNIEGFEETIQTIQVILTPADIIAMYGTPVLVVPGRAGFTIEFLGACVIYDRDTATFGGGGATSIWEEDGASVCTTVAAADGLGSATDELNIMKPLAASYQPVAGKGLVITNATGAFTNPGTAAGVARVRVSYRFHPTGL